MTRLETERLVLRPWTREDIDVYAEIYGNDDVMRFSFTRRGLTREESEQYLERMVRHFEERGYGYWAVIPKDVGRIVGYTGLQLPWWFKELLPAVELGYRYHPDYWKRGYATEAGAAALTHGFDVVGLDEIIAIYEPDNVDSGRVMERLGMRFVRDVTHPVENDLLRIYSIDRESWRARSG
jgi:RimJ/RimL family protein N-acetyltransferase